MRKVENVLMTFTAKPHQRQLLESCAPEAKFVYCEQKNLTEHDVAVADVILGNVPAALLKNATSLKFLQLNTAGSDAYAADGVLPEGTALSNATGSYGLTISEYMVGTLLSLCRKLHLYRDQQHTGVWQELGEVRSVWNSTVLVVGLGDIGGDFARKIKVFGAKVIGVRRAGVDKPDYVDELYLSDQLDALLPIADTVALCLPQTADTQGLFNRERIAMMKPGAILINIGRGSAVEDEALCDALDEGRLWGAVLDVTVPEPLPADSRLWRTKNLILTPHVSGGYTLPETQERVVRLMAENLTAFINEQPLKNVVDLKTGYRAL